MAILEVKNVKKAFGKTQVLKDVSFSLEKGEVLVIIGSSGSGKTTLLRCLNFLEKPDSGAFYFDGEELYTPEKSYTDAQLREKGLHFGLVFQQFNLFPQYSVLANITLAPDLRDPSKKEEHKETAYRLLEKIGLSDRADAYPCQLSGGQQQRVAIARALAMEPNILCFDEPTSALDPELTGEVLKVIRSLKNSDSTMIVVTHEMAFARDVADKIIFMADGVIEEAGTPDEIFYHPQSPRLQAFLSRVE